jgi:hypothetical protein
MTSSGLELATFQLVAYNINISFDVDKIEVPNMEEA